MKKIGKLIVPFVLGIIATLIVGLVLISQDHVKLISTIKYDRLIEFDEKYAKTEKIQKEILQKFYSEITEEDLMTGLYRGMFEATGDKYSKYFTADELEDYNDSTNGNYVGIGVLSDVSEDEIHITRVFPDSPAEKAGILAGDFIKEVDGDTIEEFGYKHLIDVMLGEENTPIEVVVHRDDEIVTFNLKRGKVEIPFVNSTVIGEIGYIHIYQFGTDTAKEFDEHLKLLKKQDVKGLVIDLRDNPGGLVSEATSIADELMGEGTIIYTLDNEGNRRTYSSDSAKIKMPFVFLANEHSASASEIMLGAIKDTQTAPIIGVQTFGKGIVQGITTLTDGSGYKITYSQYYTPNDNSIHKIGVAPDYIVEYEGTINTQAPDVEGDLQLKKGLEVLNELILSN